MLVTFDALRTLGLEGCTYVKPEHMTRHLDVIQEAECLLFPSYWQINSLVYGLKKRIFPSVATYQLGHNKIEFTRAMQMIFPSFVPYTEIRANTETEAQAILETFPYPFVAKHPDSARGHGVFLIQNKEAFVRYRSEAAVLYIQEWLPIERDLRVVWIGDEVVCAYWRESPGFLNNVSQGGVVANHDIPKEALALVRNVARTFGINHAGFDVAVIDGHPYLFEYNRLFGNQGLSSSVITDALRKAVTS